MHAPRPTAQLIMQNGLTFALQPNATINPGQNFFDMRLGTRMGYNAAQCPIYLANMTEQLTYTASFGISDRYFHVPSGERDRP